MNAIKYTIQYLLSYYSKLCNLISLLLNKNVTKLETKIATGWLKDF